MLKLNNIRSYPTIYDAQNAISFLQSFIAWQRWPMKPVQIDGKWLIQENQDGVYHYFMDDQTFQPCHQWISK